MHHRQAPAAASTQQNDRASSREAVRSRPAGVSPLLLASCLLLVILYSPWSPWPCGRSPIGAARPAPSRSALTAPACGTPAALFHSSLPAAAGGVASVVGRLDRRRAWRFFFLLFLPHRRSSPSFGSFQSAHILFLASSSSSLCPGSLPLQGRRSTRTYKGQIKQGLKVRSRSPSPSPSLSKTGYCKRVRATCAPCRLPLSLLLVHFGRGFSLFRREWSGRMNETVLDPSTMQGLCTV